ncbi:DeoR/GlpR family DNA-binding transcription regulator [Tropicibacter sp. R15_0]|uniref:DeoR/GlpR family DNA-binding transcription regulator n=1 Tax=Tropicibacter sp. R15_0 TaxID=2821101 RepID=UPI00256FD772|nr:DeoR/GlpR family DNA-binding transcription regulator [Tropicibacter sp. R15_0]
MARQTKKRQDNGSAPGMLSTVRRQRITEWIEEEGSARVRDLAKAFQVTEATIRQDLERLEETGRITREHGGAFLNSVPKQVASHALHHQVEMEKKQKIGRLAASLVQDGETLILDAGTTTTEVANGLAEHSNLTVITNALNIAMTLGSVSSFSVHMPGGEFKPPTLSLTGDKSVDYFGDILAGKLFLATAGVEVNRGLTYPSFADLRLKQAMIRAAQHVYLVADSTKINRPSFTLLGDLSLVQTFITDDGISDKDAKEFENRGIELLIAK